MKGKMGRRTMRLLALVAAVMFVITSTAPSNGAEPQKSVARGELTKTPRYGGTLKIVSFSEGRDIGFPPRVVISDGYRVAGAAVETLLRMDRSAKLVPWLATSFKEDAKAKTITLTLRNGVKFHDGTDFNAEAVKWNIELAVSNKGQGTDKIRSVDALNNRTVRINLTEWDNGISSYLAQNLGMIISPTAFKKNGEQWAATHPVGTGPFQFVSWQKDVRVVYNKFPGYWQAGKPYLDGVEFQVMPDPMTREFALRKGEADLSMGPAPPKSIAGLQKDGFLVESLRPGSGSTCLVPTSADPKSPWSDLRVRQAVAYAIDNTAIVKTIFLDQYEVANQWVPKGHWGYNPAVVGYSYNPAKAKKLLAEAGYAAGFKGKITYRGTSEYDQTFTAVQGFLKEVGIDITLEPLATTAALQQIAFEGGRWDGLLISGANTNPDAAAQLASRYSGGGKNYSLMTVPEDYLEAVQNGVSAPNFKSKQKWVQQADKLMIDKYALVIPIFSISDYAVSKPTVHDHGIAVTQSHLWTPENAWIER